MSRMQSVLRVRATLRRKLQEHRLLKRTVVAFVYLYATIAVVPLGAYAGVTVGTKVHPVYGAASCGLVNILKKPVNKVVNNIIGLQGLIPILIVAALVIGFLLIETYVGRRAIAYSAKLGGGAIVLGAAAAIIALFFAVKC